MQRAERPRRPARILLRTALLVAAACATAPPRADLQLRWHVEPDGEGGELDVGPDGSAVLTPLARHGGEERRLPAHGFTADPARAAAFASAATALASLPRWMHASATFAGVRLSVSLAGAVRHEASLAVAPAVRTLAASLGATDPGLAAALTPLTAQAAAPTFTFSPGDDPAPLGRILCGDGSDVPLRHLCARIAIAERANVLVPLLRPAFERSLAADGLGDYFLGSALLRLGDPTGTARVVDVALSSHPEWAAEAAEHLEACFGRMVVAPWDGAGEDPRPAQAAAFLAWFAAYRARLRFAPESGRYDVSVMDR